MDMKTKEELHIFMQQRLAAGIGMLVEHYRDCCPGDFEEMGVTGTYAPTGRRYLIRIRPIMEGE